MAALHERRQALVGDALEGDRDDAPLLLSRLLGEQDREAARARDEADGRKAQAATSASSASFSAEAGRVTPRVLSDSATKAIIPAAAGSGFDSFAFAMDS